jgi:DNA-binding transcriptional ArsR family regulator
MDNAMKATLQLAALGDAMRQSIFEMLANKPAAVAEIAQRLPISRPAVSQHLKVLKDAGLVAARSEGTRNIHYVDLEGVAVLRNHLDSLWQNALDQFKLEAEKPLNPGEEQ